MNTKIALCQLNPKSSKPEDNFKTIENTLKQYSNKNISLFVFPEDFLNGILRERKDILEAGKKFDYWTQRFSNLAKRYKVDIIPGSFPLFKNGKLYNTTIYVNNKGEILNQYSKTNLWHSEREDFSINPNPPTVFNSVLGKTMQIICWDLMDHNLFEEAIKQNVDWIINVSLWSANQSRSIAMKRGLPKNKYYNISIRKSERLNSIIETRSAEYNIGMIFCNIGGVHKYLAKDKLKDEARSAGSSQVIAPLDGVRRMVKNRREQVLIVDVPEIKDYISDSEIFWGRREDILHNYPYLNS